MLRACGSGQGNRGALGRGLCPAVPSLGPVRGSHHMEGQPRHNSALPNRWLPDQPSTQQVPEQMSAL